jgi:hypothetical protein
MCVSLLPTKGGSCKGGMGKGSWVLYLPLEGMFRWGWVPTNKIGGADGSDKTRARTDRRGSNPRKTPGRIKEEAS